MLVMERLKTIYGILGIKQLSGEALLPIVLLPIIFGIAAMSFFYMMMMCVAVPLLLAYIYWILKKTAPRTKFFYMWALCSIFYLGILFEITVPVLELLPEENFVFILCTFGSLLCFYKTKQKGAFQIQTNELDFNSCNETLVQINNNEDKMVPVENEEDNSEDENYNDIVYDYHMKTKNTFRTPKRYRCMICQHSTSRWIQHSIWLDCCIGDQNRYTFLSGCGLGIFALIFGANLSLTSICHPYFVFKIFTVNVLMPDDCSDVFDQFDIALCFIGSVYASVMAVYAIVVVLQHLYIMLCNWRREEKLHRSWCLNLKLFLCCYHR